MRRMKYLLFLLVLLCSFYNVFAEEKIVTINSVVLADKTENTIENDSPIIDDTQMNYDLVFHDTGDSITYNIKIKNNSDTHYIINQVFDDNSNEAVKYEYILPDNDFNSGEKQTIQMKITYKDEIPSNSVLENSIYHLNDNVTISVDLIEYNLYYILNPRTNPNVLFFYIIFVVLIAFGITMIKKKKTALSIIVLLIAITTYNVMAKDRETVEISLNSKVEIPINVISYNWKYIISGNYSKFVISKTIEIPNNAIDISEKQDGSIKGWIDNNTLYFGSKYRMYIPSSGYMFFSKVCDITSLEFGKDSISSKFTTSFYYMFYSLGQLEEIDTSWINTDNATDIAYMFDYCSNLKKLDLSGFYNPNVSYIYNVFYGCGKLEELDLSNWRNSPNITSIRFQYLPSTIKKLNLDNFDISHVSDFSNAFSYNQCGDLVLDLSTWDCSNISTMYYMFYNSIFKKVIIGGGEFSNLTNVQYMFYNAKIENVEFKKSTCPLLTETAYMFYYATDIGSVNIGNFDFSHVTNMYSTFYSGRFGEIIFDGIDTSGVVSMNYVFAYTKGIEKLDLSELDFDSVTTLNSFSYSSDVKEVIFGDVNSPNLKDISNMFAYTRYLEKIDWGNFNTSQIENVYYMFESSGISKLDLSSLDFSNVKSFDYFLTSTENLVEIVTPKVLPSNTSFIVDLPSIFIDSNNNRYDSIDMTTPCNTKITLDDSRAILLSGKLLNVKLKKLAGSRYTSYDYTESNIFRFAPCNTTPDLSQMTSDNIISVTTTKPIYAWFDIGTIYYYSEHTIYANPDSSYMFSFMYKLSSADFSGIDTSLISNSSNMFYYAGYNATSFEMDLSGFNTSHIRKMSSMFCYSGYNAPIWSVTGLSNWDTSNVKYMNSMFNSAGYGSPTWNIGDLSGWDTSNVINMSSMFYWVAHETDTFNINLSRWNTSNVTNMYFLFNFAALNATTWNVGDLSNWDVSKVTNMDHMFNRAAFSATTFNIGDLSNWDTSKVTNMEFTFSETGKFATWSSIGTFKIYSASVNGMFSETPPVQARLKFYNNPTSFIRTRDNMGIFTDGVTTEDSYIIVDYTSEVTDIDAIIATQPEGGHVVKGSLFS